MTLPCIPQKVFCRPENVPLAGRGKSVMSQSNAQEVRLADDDIASLYSHFGELARATRYHECVREELAADAGSRWPLLTEVLGNRTKPSDRES